MTPYDKLRSIGASVETADALAPILETLPERKREAFYLWAMDVPMRQIGEMYGMSKDWVLKVVNMVRSKVDKTL